MNFLAPAALAFAAAIPVVVLFYLLKRKRVLRLVSSTVLWQRFIADTQASAPFQKLRRNWLLVLQILLLGLVVFALARPYFAARVKPAHLRVVVLDGSASMKATDEKPSRFEKARAEALRWVDSLAGEDQMVIVLAGASTEVKQSATMEKAALRRALAACAPSDSPTRLVPALRMAESLVREQRNAEVHLFSDGAVSGLDEFENKALPLVFHRVGFEANNVGITGLDVRANPENPRQRAVYANVLNVSTNSQTVELQLRFDGRSVENRTVVVPAGQSAPQVFIAAQKEDGVFTVRLVVRDDLDADNEASIVSVLPRPVNVLLVTPGNRILEKALAAAGDVRVTVARDLADGGERYDFVVLDGVAPTVWPTVNVMAVRVSKTNWFDSVGELTSPPIVDWRTRHPLLRYSGFDNVQVVRSLAAKLPSWAVSLADAPQASLMMAGELGRQRIIWLGFDVLESNWPLRVSYAIFMVNAVEWLNPATANVSHLMVKGGEPFRMSLPRPERSASVTMPDGKVKTVSLEKENELVFGDTFEQGTYRVRMGTNETLFCANLLDAAESNILPHDEIQLGKSAKVQASTIRRANMEFWRTMALIGLVVLMGEWWYYHRRTV